MCTYQYITKIFLIRIFCAADETMISALLALWALVMAPLVYYLGRKDESFYGLSNWSVISCHLVIWEKRMICIALFADLCLSIFMIIIWCPITSVCIAVFLLTALAYSLYEIAMGTRSDIMILHLKELLKIKISSVKTGDECEELKMFLRNIDCTKEEDIDFLSEIIRYVFFRDKNDEKEKIPLWMLYRVIYFIIPRMKNNDMQILFIKNILGQTKELDEQTAVLLPLFEFWESDEAPHIRDILTAISEYNYGDEQSYRRLILRMLVYEIYLEEKSFRRWRKIYMYEFTKYLGAPVKQKDIVYMLRFWEQIYEYKRECFKKESNETFFTGIEMKRILELENKGGK